MACLQIYRQLTLATFLGVHSKTNLLLAKYLISIAGPLSSIDLENEEITKIYWRID